MQSLSNLWRTPPEVPVGATLCLEVGTFSCWIERRVGEWRVAYRQGHDPLDMHSAVSNRSERVSPIEGTIVRRIVDESSSGLANLKPTTADRPVVVRPEVPLSVPPKTDVRIYVSLPFWLRGSFGAVTTAQLDVPLVRPTDTWFGPNPANGELCYASRTQGKTAVSELTRAPGRIYAAIIVENASHDVLCVERIKLPVPYLSIAMAPDGRLWTNTLKVRHGTQERDHSVSVLDGPPREAPDAVLLADPRIKEPIGFLARTLGGLLR